MSTFSIDPREPNYILFEIEKYLLMRKAGNVDHIFDRELAVAIYEHEEDGKWYQTPTTRTDPISHDNLTACHAYYLIKFNRSPLPVFTSRTLHPRDVFYYLYARFPNKWTELGLHITGFFCYWSCAFRSKEETSGKILTWVRAAGLNYQSSIFLWWFRVCTKVLRKRYGEDYWVQIFETYFLPKFPEIASLASDLYSSSHVSASEISNA